MTSTTAPITVSMTLRFMDRLPPVRDEPSFPRPGSLLRAPRLVVARRRRALPAAQHRAGRPVGERRAAEVRQMLLLPGIVRPLARARRRVDRVMQPGMPLRRHSRGLGLAVVEHPAALAARHAAPFDEGPAAPFPIIAVAELVGADQLSPPPCEQPRPDAHLAPADLEPRPPPCHAGQRSARTIAPVRFAVQPRRRAGAHRPQRRSDASMPHLVSILNSTHEIWLRTVEFVAQLINQRSLIAL